MEEKAIELIENLANQLGVAVPYLWEVLVKQANVAALSSGIFLVVFFILLLVSSILFGTSLKKDWEFGRPVFFVFICVSGFLFIIQFFEFIYTVPTAFFNPEYWALNKIMNMM